MEEIPDSGSAGFTMARPSGLGVQEVDHILSLSHLDRVASINNFDPILQESSLKSHALEVRPVPSEELQIELAGFSPLLSQVTAEQGSLLPQPVGTTGPIEDVQWGQIEVVGINPRQLCLQEAEHNIHAFIQVVARLAVVAILKTPTKKSKEPKPQETRSGTAGGLPKRHRSEATRRQRQWLKKSYARSWLVN
jgi:hypothetical protein